SGIPQHLTLKPEVKILNDLQNLLGMTNWIRPLLGISTQQLKNLFDLLKDRDLASR
ncbi:POK6 protein, partial [Serilophus lunatus]|nr:POK6 protein [Serilophus lunatus]